MSAALSGSSLTAADVAAMVKAQLSGVNAAAARTDYIGSKMADMPKAYQDAMPVTDDPAKLYAAEQAIRKTYRDDWQKLTAAAVQRGHLPANIYSDEAIAKAVAANAAPPDASNTSTYDHLANALGGNVRVVAAPPPTKDYSSMSAQELMAEGLRGAKNGVPSTGGYSCIPGK
jgi:hypothetical protein